MREGTTLTEESRIGVPLAVAIAAASVIGGAGMTYGLIQARMSERERHDILQDRRIESLEAQFGAQYRMLERIDERTRILSERMEKKGMP